MTSSGATDPGPLAASDATDEAEIKPSLSCLLLSFLKLGASAFGGPSSVFLPSFLLVVGIAPLSSRMFASPCLNKALGGVLCSFVGLLLTVTIRFALNVHWNPVHVILSGAAFAALLMNVDVIWVVLIGALISLIAG